MICFLQILSELCTEPHVPLDGSLIEILRFGCYAIICEMHELIVQAIRVVVIGSETQVALVEIPDSQWLPRGHHYPLPDVELLIQDDHRVLYVLLNDPDLILGG